ncbi:MAG: glycerol-3-phosphate 1-O-acyltransferase PlsB [Kangiella sp.]|jgi:glycerol-3-phosphate O-acyltransferase|nr:glycerol-3-phosphate 1-O-acyltransferase PlsB [Kangiella sp.]
MSISSSLKNLSLSLLRLPLKLLVREQGAPSDPKQEFELNNDDHIIYILRTQSVTAIELLRRQASQLQLPTARVTDKKLAVPESGSCLFLNNRPSVFRRSRVNSAHKVSIAKLVQAQKANPDKTFKLVPVSIYWGRSPGKEKSFLRYFMSNVEQSGRLAKFFIMLFLGRQCLVQYGEPIVLNSSRVNLDNPPEKTAHKLSRILRVHFNRQWVATVGPRTQNRRDLIDGIVASDLVHQAVEREIKKTGKTRAQIEKQAGKYVKEIAANFSPRMIRFLSTTLTRLWNKIYAGIEVNNLKQVRQLAKDYELVYVPCHRSHADYLLLSYQLYHEGLVPPHIAAGINLNFWPVGSVLRRGGAFFLRRSFRGNKLYTAVFNEYLYRLFNKGIPVEYFQEGGRSRTGRLLTPKTGMLAMTVQSMLRGIRRPIMFVPVYIGYERMFEGKSYVGELRGHAKKQESVGQLLGVRKALKRFYGKVYLNFGQPLALEDYLAKQNIDWSDLQGQAQARPEWLSTFVTDLGDEINRRINAAVSLNSVCLVSLSLLATPRLAMDKQELIAHLDLLMTFARQAPYSEHINIPEENGLQLLDTAQKLGMVQEINDPAGDVISIEGDEAVLSTYYSNNILHVFALTSLIASIFQRHDDVTHQHILNAVKSVYPFLHQELYVRWDINELEERTNQLIQTMLDHKLLFKRGDEYIPADSEAPEWSRLMLLAQAAQPALQRYAMSLTILFSLQPEQVIHRAELEQESQKLAQRIAALYGINAPEFFDKNLFKSQVKVLKEQGWVEHREGIGMRATESCKDLHQSILSMLSIPVQQGLQQAARSLRQQARDQILLVDQNSSELVVQDDTQKED